jgi:hypothetical protein
MNLEKIEIPEIVKPSFLSAYVSMHQLDALKGMPLLYY